MGLFLQTAIVQNCHSFDVKSAIEKIERKQHLYGLISQKCQYRERNNGIQILFNAGCCGYGKMAKDISKEIGQPVLLLYVYDENYWGYDFYANGKFLDAFSPIPDYFGSVSDKEHKRLLGNSALIAQYFKIDKDDIKNYLVIWGKERVEDFETKVYEDDVFSRFDCWQMADFIKKLGYPYEFGDGTTEEEPPQQLFAAKQADAPPKAKPRSDNDKPLLHALDSHYIYSVLESDHRYDTISKLLSCGHYKQACKAFTTLLIASPYESGLYVLRAYCNKFLRKSPEMERDLENALQYDPNNVMILRARCPVTATTSHYRRHIGDLTKLLCLDAENYNRYLLSRAWKYYWVEDTESSRADMKELIARKATQSDDFDDLFKRLDMTTF